MSAITAIQVRAGIEREIKALAATDRVGPDALRDAIAITRSKIMNSPLLAERQVSSTHCLTCGGTEQQGRLFIAVLSGEPGRVNWAHIGCHAEHARRMSQMVETIMGSAGYGAEPNRKVG